MLKNKKKVKIIVYILLYIIGLNVGIYLKHNLYGVCLLKEI